jgi:hypothetical protein
MDQEPIPWMTREETETFLRELKRTLGQGRTVKPTTYWDYVEARMYQNQEAFDTSPRLVI